MEPKGKLSAEHFFIRALSAKFTRLENDAKDFRLSADKIVSDAEFLGEYS